ncbi:MAG: hypothetical protein ACJ0BB_01405 [Dehalococcoidia bacterium]
MISDEEKKVIDDITSDLNLRISKAQVQIVLRHYFTGNPKMQLWKNNDLSKLTVDTLFKWFNERKISIDEIDMSVQTIQQSVYTSHLNKMNTLNENEWSLAYFRNLGTNIDESVWLETLSIYEKERNNLPKITIPYLMIVFRVYLLTIGNIPDNVVVNLLELFRKDLVFYQDEMPEDALSVWGFIKFETWKSSENTNAWKNAYAGIRDSNDKFKIAKRKKMFKESIELENQIMSQELTQVEDPERDQGNLLPIVSMTNTKQVIQKRVLTHKEKIIKMKKEINKKLGI